LLEQPLARGQEHSGEDVHFDWLSQLPRLVANRLAHLDGSCSEAAERTF